MLASPGVGVVKYSSGLAIVRRLRSSGKIKKSLLLAASFKP